MIRRATSRRLRRICGVRGNARIARGRRSGPPAGAPRAHDRAVEVDEQAARRGVEDDEEIARVEIGELDPRLERGAHGARGGGDRGGALAIVGFVVAEELEELDGAARGERQQQMAVEAEAGRRGDGGDRRDRRHRALARAATSASTSRIDRSRAKVRLRRNQRTRPPRRNCRTTNSSPPMTRSYAPPRPPWRRRAVSSSVVGRESPSMRSRSRRPSSTRMWEAPTWRNVKPAGGVKPMSRLDPGPARAPVQTGRIVARAGVRTSRGGALPRDPALLDGRRPLRARRGRPAARGRAGSGDRVPGGGPLCHNSARPSGDRRGAGGAAARGLGALLRARRALAARRVRRGARPPGNAKSAIQLAAIRGARKIGFAPGAGRDANYLSCASASRPRPRPSTAWTVFFVFSGKLGSSRGARSRRRSDSPTTRSPAPAPGSPAAGDRPKVVMHPAPPPSDS